MKRYTVILTLSLLCALSLAGCGKKNQDKTDLTSTHTTAATETMSPTTTAAETKETEGSDKETKRRMANPKRMILRRRTILPVSLRPFIPTPPVIFPSNIRLSPI